VRLATLVAALPFVVVALISNSPASCRAVRSSRRSCWSCSG
jgi:hypothetical protein